MSLKVTANVIKSGLKENVKYFRHSIKMLKEFFFFLKRAFVINL